MLGCGAAGLPTETGPELGLLTRAWAVLTSTLKGKAGVGGLESEGWTRRRLRDC